MRREAPERGHLGMPVADSCWCVAKTIMILQSHYPPIKNKNNNPAHISLAREKSHSKKWHWGERKYTLSQWDETNNSVSHSPCVKEKAEITMSIQKRENQIGRWKMHRDATTCLSSTHTLSMNSVVTFYLGYWTTERIPSTAASAFSALNTVHLVCLVSPCNNFWHQLPGVGPNLTAFIRPPSLQISAVSLRVPMLQTPLICWLLM